MTQSVLHYEGDRLFTFRRNTDVSGVSGVGDVAYATEDQKTGEVLVWWVPRNLGDEEKCTQPSMSIHPSMKNVIRVHGHEGATEFVEAVTLEERGVIVDHLNSLHEAYHREVRGRGHDPS